MFIKVTFIDEETLVEESGLLNLNTVEDFRLSKLGDKDVIIVSYIERDKKDGRNWINYITESTAILIDRLIRTGWYKNI